MGPYLVSPIIVRLLITSNHSNKSINYKGIQLWNFAQTEMVNLLVSLLIFV